MKSSTHISCCANISERKTKESGRKKFSVEFNLPKTQSIEAQWEMNVFKSLSCSQSKFKSHHLGCLKTRISWTFESLFNIFHLLVLICSFFSPLELSPPFRNQHSTPALLFPQPAPACIPNDFRTHSKDANIIYLIMCIMPDNLEEFHEQKQARETVKNGIGNLFMRLIEINDDLWHQIRLELEI